MGTDTGALIQGNSYRGTDTGAGAIRGRWGNP